MIKIFKSEKLPGKLIPSFKCAFSKEFEAKVTCVEYFKKSDIFIFGFQNGEIAKISFEKEKFKFENFFLAVNECALSLFMIGENRCLVIYCSAIKILNSNLIKIKLVQYIVNNFFVKFYIKITYNFSSKC